MKNTRCIDIYDINHILFSAPTREKPLKNLFFCLLHFVYHFFKHTVLIRKYRYSYATKKVLLFFLSSNNNRTLKPILTKLPEGVAQEVFPQNFPISLVYWHSFMRLPLFFRDYFKATKEKRELMRLYYIPIITTYGWFRVVEIFFENSVNTRVVVLANDHTTICRCILNVAKQRELSTIYTQHASVSEDFPPLSFTYSFLDGVESLEKYQKAGEIKGSVFLTGSPRFDEIALLKERGRANVENCIGIAVNTLDDFNKVKELCLQLKDYYKLIVRPHPAMPIGEFAKLNEFGITLSDSKKETPFEFLSKINVLISNESAIHLDAVLFGKSSIVYNFSPEPFRDVYGYVKKGLVKYTPSILELKRALAEGLSISTEKAQYYYAAYHTPLDGHIGPLIANFIQAKLNNNEQAFIEQHFRKDENNLYFYK